MWDREMRQLGYHMPSPDWRGNLCTSGGKHSCRHCIQPRRKTHWSLHIQGRCCVSPPYMQVNITPCPLCEYLRWCRHQPCGGMYTPVKSDCGLWCRSIFSTAHRLISVESDAQISGGIKFTSSDVLTYGATHGH